MSSAIDVESVVVGSDLVVEFDGELDLASVPTAAALLQQHMTQGPFDRVLVHGRDLRFCDSSGLQFLLRLGPRARARAGVHFLSESRQLRRAIEIAGLRAALPSTRGNAVVG